MKKIKTHKLGTKENPATIGDIDNFKDEIEKGYFKCGCGELVPNDTTCIDCDLARDLDK